MDLGFGNRLKGVYALLTGGIAGVLKYFNNVINTKWLGRIKDQATASKYLKDAQALYACCRSILENHREDIQEGKRAAAEAVLSAIEELTRALEDFKVEDHETDAIIDKINNAIDAFKKIK